MNEETARQLLEAIREQSQAVRELTALLQVQREEMVLLRAEVAAQPLAGRATF